MERLIWPCTRKTGGEGSALAENMVTGASGGMVRIERRMVGARNMGGKNQLDLEGERGVLSGILSTNVSIRVYVQFDF